MSDLLGGRVGAGEQVAEAAPHLAEREMDIEEKRVARLARPDLAQGRARAQRAVRRLVGIGVKVALVRGIAQHHGSKVKWA
jgi:hypothetical protein